MSKKSRKNRAPAETAPHATPETETVHEGGVTPNIDADSSLLRAHHFLLGVVLIATAAIYLNSLSGKFLYDDWFQIERNRSIQSWTNAPKLLTQHVWEFVKDEHVDVRGIYYRPFFNIALLINYQLFGLNVTGWHIVSLLLHLAATALVFFLAKEWNAPATVGAAAALIFGVHPVHVEAVAWASALPDLMVAVFALASILFYEKYRNSDHRTNLWVLSITFAFLAMGSKETGIVIPIFLLARELIARDEAASVRSHTLRVLPYFLLTGIYLVIRYAVIGYILPPNPATQNVTFAQLILSMPAALVEYFRLLVFPLSLSLIYDFGFVTSAADPRFLIGAALVLLVAAALYFGKPKSNAIYLCIALFLVFLLPALNLKGLLPFESLIHDRYVYLSSAGFCIAAAMAINHLTRGISPVFATVVLVVSTVFAGLTFSQNRTWRDDTSMTENAVSHSPSNAFMRLHLGEVYEDNGRMDDAETQFRTAIEIEPKRAAGYLALANFLKRRGRTDEAERLYEQAVTHGSDLAPTWLARGGNYLDRSELGEAENAFKQALKLDPRNPVAHYNLGVTYDRLGRTPQAEAEFRAAIEVAPDLVEARSALAGLLVGQNRVEEAIVHTNFVLSSDPANIAILYPVGALHIRQKQCGPAVEALRRFSETNPAHDRSLLLLGMGYECLGQNDLAVQAFTRVIEVTPGGATAEVAKRRMERLK